MRRRFANYAQADYFERSVRAAFGVWGVEDMSSNGDEQPGAVEFLRLCHNKWLIFDEK